MTGSLPPHLAAAGEALRLPSAELAAAQRLTGDAGTRSYFRLPGARLLVTYPEPMSSAQQNWTAIGSALRDAGVRVPNVLVDAPEAGAALIEDFGDRDLSVELAEASSELRARLLDEAEAILGPLRSISPAVAARNPRFDSPFFASELSQTRHWLLEQGGTAPLSSPLRELWENQAAELARRAACPELPPVPVHRDFHANNILRAPDGQLAVIDFQDLRFGPADYDRVSLRFERGGTLVTSDPEEFSEAVLLQRAWKVIGTFAKLLSWGRSSYRPFFETAREVIRTCTRPGSDFASMLRFLP